jgi:uncharacterized protein (DUF58 family)
MPTMMGVILAIAHWWSRRALDQIVYRRRPHFRRGFPNEKVELQVEVENRKFLPVSWLRVQDPWPEAVGPEEDGVLGPYHIPQVGLLTNVFSLRWFENRLRRYTLLLRRRGVYLVGPARLESGDLFGFYEQSAEIGTREKLTVFPEVIPFSELPLPTDDPFGEIRSSRRIYEDPTMPMGVREYQPEDDIRRVHWPASARTGQLQVKVYQPVSARVVVVALNISTFSHHWEGTNRKLLEYAISLTAGLVSRGIEVGHRVGMISNGCLTNSDQPFRILPGASTRHLATLLEALAGVTPLITAPFASYLMREVPHLPYRASLMLVTAVIPPELPETLVQLKRHGRQITVISLDSDPPTAIPGIRMVHAPFQPRGRKITTDGSEHHNESGRHG